MLLIINFNCISLHSQQQMKSVVEWENKKKNCKQFKNIQLINNKNVNKCQNNDQ